MKNKVLIDGSESIGEMWAKVYQVWTEICKNPDQERYAFLLILLDTDPLKIDLYGNVLRAGMAEYFNECAVRQPDGEVMFNADTCVLLALTAYAFEPDGARFRKWAKQEWAKYNAA